MPENYELIEHTADIGIKVKGQTLQDLFANAASALFDIMAEQKTGKSVTAKAFDIELTAPSLEDLFQNWLGELLSLSAAKEVVFSDFTILDLNDNSIKAKASGQSRANYTIKTEIKAVTYHELEIEKTERNWEARVIFDV